MEVDLNWYGYRCNNPHGTHGPVFLADRDIYDGNFTARKKW
jgi:hypothetical protein